MGYEIPVNVQTASKTALKVIAVFIILVFIAIFAFNMIAVVKFGYVGIMLDPITGNIWNVGVGPKYVFKLPWQIFDQIYIGQETLDMWTSMGRQGEYPAINAFTSDGLQASVDITIQYHIDPKYAVEIYMKYPRKDWEDRTLAPVLRQIVRDIIADYKGTDTIPKRDEISQKISEEFLEKLKELGVSGIVIDSINLRNIDLPEQFKKALESKLTAEQQKIQAEYERERIITLANATAMEQILHAKGEAESQILRAEAEAKAKLIIANATKVQIELITKAFGDPVYALEYYKYFYLAEMAKQGAVIVISGEAQPLISIPTSD
ncbi:MAG: hypothetical protein B6U95_08010 [Thermofilum sp. ex4484_82]|nr:MAG: hypothetical protein B6U95_08010 [Thermofilum sp. ex4484_82]OYT36726.1 MAG: hypothetical protein B6U96_08010 [Archaeoglobales archaeon ex4484_92]